MTYDIHTAALNDNPKKSVPMLSLNVQQHASVFCQNKESLRQFPLFDGMSNYYGDTAFFESEKEALREELIELLKIYGHGEAAALFIVELLKIVDQAISDGFEIYCFGD